MSSRAATYEREARTQLAAAALALLELIGKYVPEAARPAVIDAVHKTLQLTRTHERLSILARAYSDDAPEGEAEPEMNETEPDDTARRLAHIKQICDRLDAVCQH